MNYIGSKHSLLHFIENTVSEIADGNEKSFCDLFAGTGAVGRHFKSKGYRVIANDIQYYAYVLNKAYLEIDKPPAFVKFRKRYRNEMEKLCNPSINSVQQVLTFLNHIKGKRGFIAENYSTAGKRFYYTQENAERADAIRQALEEWYLDTTINESEYYYLLASLLEAVDQVANTASVYGAYLKKFKSSARRPFILKPLELTNQANDCCVYNENANHLVGQIECDILYLDPPYNHRQYGANYHVLETIASYDNPQLRGVTGLRDYPRSDYCKPKVAQAAFTDLIRSAQAKHILVSYNDEGIISLEEAQEILRLRGEPKTFHTTYNRFKADNDREYKRNMTIEYLHYVRVIN